MLKVINRGVDMKNEDFSIGKNLKKIRENKGLSMEKLSKIIDVSHTTIYRIEAGVHKPKADILKKLAQALGVSTDYILGLRTDKEIKEDEDIKPGDIRKNLKMIPVVGEISAGNGIDPIEDIIDMISIPEEKQVDFALFVKGDSMTPKFQEGDLALVIKTPVLENGEIGVIAINGYKAVLKKFYQYESLIQLISLNPEYEPIVIKDNDLKDVHIFGRVVGKLSFNI